MKWIAFCSQTGSEIMNLSERVHRYPILIVTNNILRMSEKVLFWIKDKKIDLITIPRNPEEGDYRFLRTYSPNFITLHGYLRKIPSSVCNSYYILNGHPGLITVYPELKGKDPQRRAYLLQHKQVGSVIHKVTPEIDGGEILIESQKLLKENIEYSREDYFTFLKETSLTTWELFFKSME